jgi:hypothetical protein
LLGKLGRATAAYNPNVDPVLEGVAAEIATGWLDPPPRAAFIFTPPAIAGAGLLFVVLLIFGGVLISYLKA